MHDASQIILEEAMFIECRYICMPYSQTCHWNLMPILRHTCQPPRLVDESMDTRMVSVTKKRWVFNWKFIKHRFHTSLVLTPCLYLKNLTRETFGICRNVLFVPRNVPRKVFLGNFGPETRTLSVGTETFTSKFRPTPQK